MKISHRNWIALFFITFFSFSLQAAAVRVAPSAPVEKEASLDEERMEKARVKMERNSERYEKRLKRLERKMKKRGLTAEGESQDVWDDSKFRLGILLLLVAIGLGIIAAIISLGGLFSFMAGLFALGGIILVIWSLVEYYG